MKHLRVLSPLLICLLVSCTKKAEVEEATEIPPAPTQSLQGEVEGQPTDGEETAEEESTIPEVNYQPEQRSNWIEQALLAFAESVPDQPLNIYKYLKNISDYSCSSASQQLRLQCLIQAGQNSCEGVRNKQRVGCNLISDIVVTNLTEEKLFLTRTERFKILRKAGVKNDQYLKAVFRKYAATTTQFLLDTKEDSCEADDFPCLAKSVNSYCLVQADAREMSWQGCAGAIVWFIGTHIEQRKN